MILSSLDTSIEGKIPKLFFAGRPHARKVPYFNFLAETSDACCTGHAHIGPPHGLINLSNATAHALHTRGLASKHTVDFKAHMKYKYLYYVDGNTISDRMRFLLSINCVPVRDQSSSYEEIYTPLLQSGVHYVPIDRLDDLPELIQSLEASPRLVARINHNNHEFVRQHLHYDVLLEYVAILINELYRDIVASDVFNPDEAWLYYDSSLITNVSAGHT
jgi:hypothetical protein